MKNERSDDPENEIEQLRNAYAADIPAKARELKQALVVCLGQLSQGHSPDWKEVEYFAHKLCGSSGTYGFLHLAAVCAHLEDLVSDGSLSALVLAQPAHATEHLTKWLVTFEEQARLARERKPPTISPKDLVLPLKQHLAKAAGQRAA